MWTDPGYSSKRAAEAAGISYRRLDFWARTDVLRPSVVDASGSGSRRRYSIADVRILRALAAVVEQGAQIGKLRPIVAELSRLAAWEGQLFVSPAGRVGLTLDAVAGEPIAWVFDLASFTAPMPEPSRLALARSRFIADGSGLASAVG